MISIVIPVLNEKDSLRELHSQILESCRQHELTVEIIFVDDGSTDGSWEVISELSANQRNVHGIRFRKNFGKAAALSAGMKRTQGEYIMMMDADLQDDPAEIPRFLAKLQEGYDVVNGWKKKRLDPWHKVYPSKVFNWLASYLSKLKLHDHNCGFKLFRSEVAKEIRLYGEFHRFIPVLAHARGFKVTEIPVHHRQRKFGRSKYGIRRFLRGFLDLSTVTFLTSFSYRPQHMIGAMGILFLLLGFIGLGFLSVLWILMNLTSLVPPMPIGNRPLLFYSITFTLLGAQGLTLGLLAELIVANTARQEDIYSVSQITPDIEHRETVEELGE